MTSETVYEGPVHQQEETEGPVDESEVQEMDEGMKTLKYINGIKFEATKLNYGIKFEARQLKM